MNESPSNLLLWFGVLGGPLAWATQFVANLYLSFARCDSGRWHLPIHVWQIGLSTGALVVGLAAFAVATRLYRQTADVDGISQQVLRGFGGHPPAARVHFLAICALVVNLLTLIIIVMTGIGAPLLSVCQQS